MLRKHLQSPIYINIYIFTSLLELILNLTISQPVLKKILWYVKFDTKSAVEMEKKIIDYIHKI